MLTAFIRAFRTPDLRKKLLFTLGIVALFRFGSTLPAPGISQKRTGFVEDFHRSADGNGSKRLKRENSDISGSPSGSSHSVK